MADPPYGIIASALERARVVPFLGAGVNFGTRPPNAKWDKAAPFLPGGAELARYLAQLSNFPSTADSDLRDLPKVASYYVEAGGREGLRHCLRTVFDRDYPPGDIHTGLSEIAARHPMLIVTTNYDDLLERAFANQRYDLVSHINDTDREDWAESVLFHKHRPGDPDVHQAEPVTPSKLAEKVDLMTTSVIYKMHGAIDRRPSNDWDSYVISEDDYVDFLSRMTRKTAIPPVFLEHFSQRQFLFLGYGLSDWNLRLVLRDVFANRRRRLDPSWAIQRGVSGLESSLWDSRRVDIYDADINQFIRELQKFLSPTCGPRDVAAGGG